MALKNKFVSASEAAALIQSNDTVCVSGFIGISTPDELILALERRFLETRAPTGLTLVFAAGPGDGKERGLNRLAHESLSGNIMRGCRAFGA
jgi:propionate CoA-transferase